MSGRGGRLALAEQALQLGDALQGPVLLRPFLIGPPFLLLRHRQCVFLFGPLAIGPLRKFLGLLDSAFLCGPLLLSLLLLLFGPPALLFGPPALFFSPSPLLAEAGEARPIRANQVQLVADDFK